MLTALALNQKMPFITKKHFLQSVAIQFRYFFTQSSLLFFMVAVKSCFFTGLLAICPHSISLRRSVLELTFTPDDDKSFLSISLVFLASSLLSRNNLISSLVEAFLFPPHFSFLLNDNVPVARACFKSRETVDWFTSTILAISHWFFSVCLFKVSIFIHLRGVVSI